MDARSSAKTNALTTELTLQLLGIILYILLNFMNFLSRFMKGVGLQLCCIVMSTSGSGIRMTQDLTDELNNSTASTFRRKFRLL